MSHPTAQTGTLGGLTVDPATQMNTCLLRCKFCSSRLLSKSGKLTKRFAADQTLWIPRPIPSSPTEFTWESTTHEHWWCIPDLDDFDNVGMSRSVESPAGFMQIVLCSECQGGPYGYRVKDEQRVWMPCDLLIQQDPSDADDKEDFKVPENANIEQLKSMINTKELTTQFRVVFEEIRLGMMLNNSEFKEEGDGVEVMAFTITEQGEIGAAEKCGEVKVGDRIVRVNEESTKGMDVGVVLDLICNSSRPITILFERSPKKGGEVEAEGGGTGNEKEMERVQHSQWTGGAGKE